MPVSGVNSPGHDVHLINYSSAGVHDSVRLNTGALCSRRSQRFDLVCAEIPQKDSNEIESPTATRSTKSDRYKTELCRQFGESGSCRYGDKCQFAHGVVELRVVERHPKYKTNLCRTFHSTGFCPYGARCHFIHGEMSAPSPAINPGFKTARWSTMKKQNSCPLDVAGFSVDHGMSMNDNAEVERLISGIQALMDCSVMGSSLHLVQENMTPVLPSQRHLSPSFLSSMEAWPSAFYLTDLMGSTSVTPSLSCSDSPTPSPTSALSDVDIWKSLANAFGVGV